LRKSRFLHFGDRQTDEQMDIINALSRSRCRKRRLNTQLTTLNAKWSTEQKKNFGSLQNTSYALVMQQMKQSTNSNYIGLVHIHNTNWGDKSKFKRKGRKSARCKVHRVWCMTEVHCSVIGNALGAI